MKFRNQKQKQIEISGKIHYALLNMQIANYCINEFCKTKAILVIQQFF